MRLLNSRRFMAAALSIVALTVISVVNGTDTSMAIASVAIAVAGANAMEKKNGNRDPQIDP